VSSRKFSKTPTRLWRVEAGGSPDQVPARPDRAEARSDMVATEEPLEIRLRWGGTQTRTVAVTMRTPGADRELAAGFLFAEGVIAGAAEIARITPLMAGPGGAGLTAGPSYVPAADAPKASGVSDSTAADELEAASACSNVLEVELEGEHAPELASLERHFFATSACGVCGKAGLETLRLRVSAEMPPGPCIAPALIASLPAKLRAAQGLFEATGGLHAAALFDSQGELLAVREDVGRHNALDKLVGWALLAGRLPLHDHVLLVSGRTSYEILQKSVVAGLPVVCAISAPSSLAVELAQRFGVTLVGFLRGERCNVYSGIERIGVTPAEPAEGSVLVAAEPRQRRRERFAILPASGDRPGASPARRRPL
jgi:FdhD protein